MKVLGFLVPAAKGAARDDRRRRISGAGGVKTIRASGLPSAMFRPSTDTRYHTDDDDEGPFFDLVFPLTLKSELSETSDQSDAEPHDGFFFSGGLLTLDAPETTTRSRSHFRVLKLGAKKIKPKPESETRHHENAVSATTPLSSLLARDTGLRGCTSARSTSAKLFFEVGSPCQDHEKRSTSTLTSTPLAIQKYLSKIKPFYVRVSRGFGERLRFGQAGSEPTGMKLVARRLRKSRSASSAVAAVRSPQAAVAPPRRDDSLVEKEDGIEGAIAHCKRSFNEGSMELPLIRSRSDPGEGKRVTI